MRVRSRCRTCGRGIELPPHGEPRPRLCRRHRIRQRLAALIGTAATRVLDVLVRPVRRMGTRAGGGHHRVPSTVTPAADQDVARGTHSQVGQRRTRPPTARST
ncbi:MAG: hypothetical protein ACR2GH_08860 [Pseudonocardia sp.]